MIASSRSSVVVSILLVPLLVGPGWKAGAETASRPASVIDPVVRTVLGYQQAYVNSIDSLAFKVEVTLDLSCKVQQSDSVQAGAPVPKTIVTTMDFVSKGQAYRLEVESIDVRRGGRARRTAAYDGDLHQVLEPGERPLLLVSRNKRLAELFVGAHPLLRLYQFAASGPEATTLSDLGRSTTWADVGERVLSWEPSVRDGRSGVAMKLNVPSKVGRGQDLFEVFFADVDYLPVYWKATIEGSGTSECEVVATESRTPDPGRPICFPTRIEAVERFPDGAVGQRGRLEVPVESLQVNHPVDARLFTIPPSTAAKRVDLDTRTEVVPRGRDPEFVRALMAALWDPSPDRLRTLSESLTTLKQQAEPLAKFGALLREHYGRLKTVGLRSCDLAERIFVDSLWTVVGEKGALDLKMRLDNRDDIVDLRFRTMDCEGFLTAEEFVLQAAP